MNYSKLSTRTLLGTTFNFPHIFCVTFACKAARYAIDKANGNVDESVYTSLMVTEKWLREEATLTEVSTARETIKYSAAAAAANAAARTAAAAYAADAADAAADAAAYAAAYAAARTAAYAANAAASAADAVDAANEDVKAILVAMINELPEWERLMYKT